MTKQVIIGLHTEGVTDKRFLESVVKRTFEEVAFECVGDIEILDIQLIKVPKQEFIKEVKAAQIGYEKYGIMVLCVHADSDSSTDKDVFEHKILPAFEFAEITEEEEICKNLVAVVPIQMIEAWILADKELFKEELGTDKSDQDLGINKKPESLSDPKKTIEEAIKIAFSNLPKRRRKPTIGELYGPIGQKIKMNKLEKLPSYLKFKEGVRDAFKKLNYLH